MNICKWCEQENHDECLMTRFVRGDVVQSLCSCANRNHALKTYVIQATFEVQEFSPSNAKSVLSDLLKQNSKLPSFALKIVFPVEQNPQDPCICGQDVEQHSEFGGCSECSCTVFQPANP